MREMTEQLIVDRIEEGDKEKKKKRRSNRRCKNNSSVSGTGCNSVNGIYGEASDCLGNGSTLNSVMMPTDSSSSLNCGFDNHALNAQGLSSASYVAFSSLPSMHINDEVADLGSMHDQYQFPSVLEGTTHSRSCPVPICHDKTKGPFQNKDFFSKSLETKLPENEFYVDMQRNYFVRHWSAETVNEAIEKGDVFKASFRVNAHNRLEAYCTIDGVPTDVLINGAAAQNRAVEGDIVAIKLDPVALWTRLKGSAGHSNNSAPIDDSNMLPKVVEVIDDEGKGKEKLVHDYKCNGHRPSVSDSSNVGYVHENNEVSSSIKKICAIISSFPFKRPTGRVVGIIEGSHRRGAVVGFLDVKQWLSHRGETKKNKNSSFSNWDFIQLTPNDAKFPNMWVSVRSLPDCIKKRLEVDATVEMDLVTARIDDWREENLLPLAHVMHIFGRGGEINSQIAAILFENAICSSKFSPESLSCLPDVPWELPAEELERRKDLRSLCTITIDPSTAIDLDDALSVEWVSDSIFRVGVHIADASYFVLPDTALDVEAQYRSTAFHLQQRKIPMLPSMLSEDLGSLIPGVDRLAFSIIFDFNLVGDVVDRWIGRTVIRSCCKLSYQHAQDIIAGLMDVGSLGSGCPKLYGHFEWQDVIKSVKCLNEISTRLKENRFKDGALCFDNRKLFFFFDECGIPYGSTLYEQTESDFLVEEFMLLANRTAAEVISRAFPDCALLRRQPKPNARKLREFEAFCRKHGLEIDTSTSGQFHLSLGKIWEKLKNDPVMFDIILSYASKSMQSATYFCTGDYKERENEWAHYALAIPLYTHFTSPLRRYPDIVVHRSLAAAIEAEDIYLQTQRMVLEANKGDSITRRCFTSLHFDKDIVESKEFREALSAAALNHRLPSTEMLAEIAANCNKRMMASKHAEDAGRKLYLWAMLKKKETLIAEARVLGLGPKFMSIYIHKLSIERRICYDDVEGLAVEWLETTSTLVLDLCTKKHSQRRGSPGKTRPLEDVAWVINTCDLKPKKNVFSENNTQEVGTTQEVEATVEDELGISEINEMDPPIFPLTVGLLSTIHVALHAIGGDDGALDIGARLYATSYLR